MVWILKINVWILKNKVPESQRLKFEIQILLSKQNVISVTQGADPPNIRRRNWSG